MGGREPIRVENHLRKGQSTSFPSKRGGFKIYCLPVHSMIERISPCKLAGDFVSKQYTEMNSYCYVDKIIHRDHCAASEVVL